MKINDNVISSASDERDFIFDVNAALQLPTRVDLRHPLQEIEDQETTGSCTANAICSYLEWIGLQRGEYFDLSRFFVYWNERNDENRIGQDGAQIRDGLKSVKNVGVCSEFVWPFDLTRENVRPIQGAYDEAARMKLIRFERLPIIDGADLSGMIQNIQNIKAALAQGYPVLIGFDIKRWFFRMKGDMHDHATLDISDPNFYKSEGGHCTVLYGYDDSMSGSIGLTSYGTGFGDGGYYMHPYTALGQDVFEAWVLKGFIVPETQPILPPTLAQQGYAKAEISLAALYVGMFGRAPDAAGFNYWMSALSSKIGDDMYNSPKALGTARSYYACSCS